MRQVPVKNSTDYLIVGNGKLAHHFAHYFNLLEVNFLQWTRQSGQSLSILAEKTNKVILLIPDSEIEPFISNHPELMSHKLIHCSGALSTSLAESAHPLMTFADTLYDLDTYKSIAFVTEADRSNFADMFPELPNKSYQIGSDEKNYYHAWCSMAGNFTTMLWSEFFKRLKIDFDIDKDAALPYLNQIKNNLYDSMNPLTGPFERGDNVTIQKHLIALENDNYAEVYKAFYTTYFKGNETKDK